MRKIGIVELNTTNVRLVIADVLDTQGFVITDKLEDSLKISLDLLDNEIIKQASTSYVNRILSGYKAFFQSCGVEEIYAVASNEYSDAKNQHSFFDEIYSSTGFKFKIMSEEEQAEYLYLSFINSMDCPKGLIVSINGTNTQILAYNRRNVLQQTLIKLGSVTLAEKYADKKITPSKIMDGMTKNFSDKLKEIDWFKNLDEETQIVGTGDGFISLAKLSKKLRHYPYLREHSYQLTSKDFTDVYDFVKDLDIDKTKKLKGISSERADVLASNLCVINSVIKSSGISNLIVSSYGVAEGIIFSKACPITLEKPITDVLGFSLDTLNDYYNNANIKNTKNVYDLSVILFKQLKVLHKLPRNFVKVLRVASMMHDCGKRISSTDYQKKGFDVVLNSDILGINQREQVLAAFAVACQNLDDFSMTEWVKYSSLFSANDLEGVRKLAIIVKLASSLDLFASGKVKDISCDILGDSVIMKTIVNGSADLEIMESKKVCGDFAKAFKKHLEIL